MYQVFIQIQIEMAEYDTDKKNPCDTKWDAGYFYFTQHNSKGDN